MAAEENERSVVMGKLVRDRIPEIIKNDGKNSIIEILSNEDYMKELDKKLNEEVAEYRADKSIEKWQMSLRCYLQYVKDEDILWKDYCRCGSLNEKNEAGLRIKYTGLEMRNNR